MTEDLFRGTAYYYERFRPPYPKQLLSDLLDRTIDGSAEHMVDLGCGTGEVCVPLSFAFASVTAIDVDGDMVAAGRRRAAAAGRTNITWLVGRAEELELPPASCDLVVSGSAFHWMDRELLSRRCYDALRPGCALALIGGGSRLWESAGGWQEIVRETIKRWLGEKRRAGSGTYQVDKVHEDFLVPAGFRLETKDYVVEHTWSLDSLVGYLYSTSFANIDVLGDRREGFEADLRSRLLEHSPDGVFPERLEFYLMIGYRP